ncbi:MAG: cobalt-precorrin-6A reductase [Pseudomonadota bacterium]
MRRLLVLAGTAEARALCTALANHPAWEVIAALAGATDAPAALPVETRTGGFGGAAGLAEWLRRERIAAIVDATHPYAARISANAVEAAARAGLPLLRLERPPWIRPANAIWHEVANLEAAAAAVPSGARALLSTGARDLGPFAARADVWWLLRAISPPGGDFPLPQGVAIPARLPLVSAEEEELMRAHRISHLVTRNAGGDATRAKIDAAARLGLTTVILIRPALPPANTVKTVADAQTWLAEVLP